jgi:benzylsuccinate CoA-transferase BbsF subunit
MSEKALTGVKVIDFGWVLVSPLIVSVVQNARDIYEDPQIVHRGFFWKMDHHEMDPFTHLDERALLSETPATPELPAPCLGEHTEMVCKELLGMDDEEFVNYMINGAFGF